MTRRGLATGLVVAILAMTETAGLPAQSRRASRAPQIHNLTLEDGIAPIGRIGGFTGRVGADGHRIVAENLSVVQPVTVLAIARDNSAPIRVDLVKGSWDRSLRSATTGDSDRVVFKTRTEGNLGILIRAASDTPAPFALVVWAGDEMPSEPAPIFTRPAGRRGSRGGGQGRMVWSVALLAGLAAAGLYVWRRQGRGRAAS